MVNVLMFGGRGGCVDVLGFVGFFGDWVDVVIVGCVCKYFVFCFVFDVVEYDKNLYVDF